MLGWLGTSNVTWAAAGWAIVRQHSGTSSHRQAGSGRKNTRGVKKKARDMESPGRHQKGIVGPRFASSRGKGESVELVNANQNSEMGCGVPRKVFRGTARCRVKHGFQALKATIAAPGSA